MSAGGELSVAIHIRAPRPVDEAVAPLDGRDEPMTLYMFHAFRADGAPLALEAVALPSRRMARAHAVTVLDAHRSARSITVWQDDKEVTRLERREA